MTDQHSIPKAAGWMAGSLTLLLIMMVAGRESTRHLSTFQVMEMRSVIGFAMLLPLVLGEGGFGAMRTRRPLAHIGRNVAHYAGQWAWLFAIGLIPIAQVIAIEFTTPIWTAIFAALFLGERLSIRKIGAIVFGLVGVMVVIRPDITQLEPGQMVVLGAAVAFGISFVMVKSLTRTDSVVTIIFWMLIVQSAIGLVPAILVWQTPPADTMPWIVLIAFCGTFSHYCMARAMVHADATVVMPMDFLRVPLAAVVGYLVYAEVIDTFTALGAALILFGNLLNIPRRRSASPGTVPAP